jgi:hypothetical protein
MISLDMTESLTEPIAALPRKYFLHEAAHAIALYSLGAIPVSMSVTVDADPRLTHGSVMPPAKFSLSLPEYVFVKMSGPASHIYLGTADFEMDRNNFQSDFASVLRSFPSLATTRDQAGQTLTVCKQFLETDCRSWVEANHSLIDGLAVKLKSAPNGSRYELEGLALRNAIASCANEKISEAVEHRDRINKSFLQRWNSAPPFDAANAPDWIKLYVANAVELIH